MVSGLAVGVGVGLGVLVGRGVLVGVLVGAAVAEGDGTGVEVGGGSVGGSWVGLGGAGVAAAIPAVGAASQPPARMQARARATIASTMLPGLLDGSLMRYLPLSIDMILRVSYTGFLIYAEEFSKHLINAYVFPIVRRCFHLAQSYEKARLWSM
jgi:hypothetical protein